MLQRSPSPIGLLLLCSLCCGCSDLTEADRVRSGILGGMPAARGAWPGVGWLDAGCTGVLVAPDLIIYAAHCGDAIEKVYWGQDLRVLPNGTSLDVVGAARAVGTKWCRTHPEGFPTSGSDIGFCVLEETGIEAHFFPRIATGCYREALEAGMEATLVGFGLDATSTFGQLRATRAAIRRISREIEIGDAQMGTCRGDSGGPAFVDLRGDLTKGADWALVGVLSSGVGDEACGQGYYTDVAAMLPWLEAESGRDLSGCASTEQQQFRAQDCRQAWLDSEGVALSHEPGERAALCGRTSRLNAAGGCQLSTPVGSGGASIGSRLLLAIVALTACRGLLRRQP